MKRRLAHPPQKPKRRTPTAWRGAVRKYAVSIGELIWAANRSQASFADLFSVLVDPNKLDAGLAIWFSMQTDKAQLTALKALLKVRATSASRIYRSTQWAISAAEKLAEIRNDAAHMATSPAIGRNGTTLAPNPIGNTATRLQRRDGKDFLKLFSQAKGDYVQLQQYAHDIFCNLAYPEESYPLPLRPKLNSVVVQQRKRQ